MKSDTSAVSGEILAANELHLESAHLCHDVSAGEPNEQHIRSRASGTGCGPLLLFLSFSSFFSFSISRSKFMLSLSRRLMRSLWPFFLFDLFSTLRKRSQLTKMLWVIRQPNVLLLQDPLLCDNLLDERTHAVNANLGMKETRQQIACELIKVRRTECGSN